MTSMRSRWAAIGAAVAVTLGAGGISLGQAAINSGDKPVFVGIEPCRLVDTRPDTNIGGRTTPLGANDTLTLQVTGSTGQCTGIPADATAAAMNVTAIQGSTRSYLSIYPADAARPNASNLNWNGGDPPTPNKVDVKLSSTGAINLTNNAGTVHVAADLVGYYIDHTHDDRYYTKSQVDQQRALSKSISLNVYADPGLNFDERYASLIDSGVGGLNLDVDFNFTVPPDYTPGAPIELRMLAYARDSTSFPCNGQLSASWIYVTRAGVGKISGGGSDLQPSDILKVFSTPGVPEEYMFTPELDEDIQPGDGFGFGVFGLGPATRCDLIITAASVHYD